MKSSRIAELLQPFLGKEFEGIESSARLFESISIYIDILMKWNARINLTAIRNEEEIVTRHFGESLFAAGCLFPDAIKTEHGRWSATAYAGQTPSVRVADLGSGAGFPGLPIKLWAPNIILTLVESNQKKCAFLREVVRALELKNVSVEGVRAETFPDGSFDVVTVRAVERFANVLPIAVRVVAREGRVCLMIASSQTEGLASMSSVKWEKPIAVPLSDSRFVVIGKP